MFEEKLREKNMTIYQCAKMSGIPYTTLSEVVRGKTRLEKCSAETVYRLSQFFNVTMEDLMRSSFEKRLDFEVFKSNVCHRLKDVGDIDFIVDELQKDQVNEFWRKKWYAEAFYLLAMIDYLCRLNDIPMCTRYDDIRKRSLDKPLYPRDVLLASKLSNDINIRERSKREAIPEFLQFNIIESEVRNVY